MDLLEDVKNLHIYDAATAPDAGTMTLVRLFAKSAIP
jgi:hypothetical protein